MGVPPKLQAILLFRSRNSNFWIVTLRILAVVGVWSIKDGTTSRVRTREFALNPVTHTQRGMAIVNIPVAPWAFRQVGSLVLRMCRNPSQHWSLLSTADQLPLESRQISPPSSFTVAASCRALVEPNLTIRSW